MVLKSEFKLQNAKALQDSISVACQNTTGYDKSVVDDYICTPACNIPDQNDTIMHDWTKNQTRPEFDEVVTYKCTGGYQIVPMANFTRADPGAPLQQVELTCTMTGKYDKSKTHAHNTQFVVFLITFAVFGYRYP